MHPIATLLALILLALLWPAQTRRALRAVCVMVFVLQWVALGVVAAVVAWLEVVRFWPTSGLLLVVAGAVLVLAYALRSTGNRVDGWLERAYARRNPRYEVLWRAMDRAVARLEARGVNLTGPVDELQRAAWFGREQREREEAARLAGLKAAIVVDRQRRGITGPGRTG